MSYMNHGCIGNTGKQAVLIETPGVMKAGYYQPRYLSPREPASGKPAWLLTWPGPSFSFHQVGMVRVSRFKSHQIK
ncbi:MAG: hypothetical protein GY940_46975 [bacterium]|nr:hypothetical protein [bacterium]